MLILLVLCLGLVSVESCHSITGKKVSCSCHGKDEIIAAYEPVPQSVEMNCILKNMNGLANPDFENEVSAVDNNIVSDYLGADSLPVYAHDDEGTPTTHGVVFFDQWFHVTREELAEEGIIKNFTALLESSGGSDVRIWQANKLEPLESKTQKQHFTLQCCFVMDNRERPGEYLHVWTNGDAFVFFNNSLVASIGGVDQGYKNKMVDMKTIVGVTNVSLFFAYRGHKKEYNKVKVLVKVAMVNAVCAKIQQSSSSSEGYDQSQLSGNSSSSSGTINCEYGCHSDGDCEQPLEQCIGIVCMIRDHDHCGTCVYKSKYGSVCDDGLECTYEDLCSASGICLGLPVNCSATYNENVISWCEEPFGCMLKNCSCDTCVTNCSNVVESSEDSACDSCCDTSVVTHSSEICPECKCDACCTNQSCPECDCGSNRESCEACDSCCEKSVTTSADCSCSTECECDSCCKTQSCPECDCSSSQESHVACDSCCETSTASSSSFTCPECECNSCCDNKSCPNCECDSCCGTVSQSCPDVSSNSCQECDSCDSCCSNETESDHDQNMSHEWHHNRCPDCICNGNQCPTIPPCPPYPPCVCNGNECPVIPPCPPSPPCICNDGPTCPPSPDCVCNCPSFPDCVCDCEDAECPDCVCGEGGSPCQQCPDCICNVNYEDMQCPDRVCHENGTPCPACVCNCPSIPNCVCTNTNENDCEIHHEDGEHKSSDEICNCSCPPCPDCDSCCEDTVCNSCCEECEQCESCIQPACDSCCEQCPSEQPCDSCCQQCPSCPSESAENGTDSSACSKCCSSEDSISDGQTSQDCPMCDSCCEHSDECGRMECGSEIGEESGYLSCWRMKKNSTGCYLVPRMQGVRCDDKDECTRRDRCDGNGECIGEVLKCANADPCVVVGCADGDCVVQSVLENCHGLAWCSTSSDCMQIGLDYHLGCMTHVCMSGVCTAVERPDDTECVPAGKCSTSGICVNGECVPTESYCDDGNITTCDSCVEPCSGIGQPTCDHIPISTHDSKSSNSEDVTCMDDDDCEHGDGCVFWICDGALKQCKMHTAMDNISCYEKKESRCLGIGKCHNSKCEYESPEVGIVCERDKVCAEYECDINGCHLPHHEHNVRIRDSGNQQSVNGHLDFGQCKTHHSCASVATCNGRGMCLHTDEMCDDGNACTHDACTEKGCTHVPIHECGGTSSFSESTSSQVSVSSEHGHETDRDHRMRTLVTLLLIITLSFAVAFVYKSFMEDSVVYFHDDNFVRLHEN